MSTQNNEYYALHFQSTDELHRKGDIQYMLGKTLYIGQTDECTLLLPCHPDYADACYAVIVKNENTTGWRLIRQETEADITVNGVALELVQYLKNGDLIKFDQTVIKFTEEHDTYPQTQYIQNKPAWSIWVVLACIVIIVSGVISFLYREQRKPEIIYKQEIPSICKIEADTLIVLYSHDTLAVIPTDRTLVGTGFITEDGFFVTARHCVEFWLTMEDELRPNLHDIRSPFVRWAIDAEMDTAIHLVSLLTIKSFDDSKLWRVTSDQFIMDKSHDAIYDYGDAETAYLWRSVVSLFEKKDTELGDVAVMPWENKGHIRLAESNQQLLANEKLYCFGYPQSEGSNSRLVSQEGKVFLTPKSQDDWFVCDIHLDPGFSGGPIFCGKGNRFVAGIVSRSAGNHTLIVPSSQIHHLIHKLEQP